MKPFLLLQSRPEDAASNNEFESFWKLSGLRPEDFVRIRMEKDELPDLTLSDYSGVIMGGGPANMAASEERKSPVQKRFEGWMLDVVKDIVATDTPFLGTCLGFGALVKVLNGEVSFDYPEPVGPIEIVVEPAGLGDSLLRTVPQSFLAFVGHKEGVGTVPEGAVELARSATCSQMIRVGDNVYATQFHPELDGKSLALRIQTYRNAGYFHPDEADQLINMALEAEVSYPVKILQAFAFRYRT